MMHYDEQLLRRIRALEQDAMRRRRRARIGLISAGVGAVACIVGTSRPAWSQACAETLPAPLAAFCAGQPARAAEVNSNFRHLYNWINSKLGDPTSARVVIEAQDEADPDGQGGSLVVGNPKEQNLALDGNEILARTKGKGSALTIQASPGAGDTLLNPEGGRVGVGTTSPRAKLDVAGPLFTNGDIRNMSADGQVAISSNYALRDTGDDWLRLTPGPDRTGHANLAVRELWTEQKLIRMMLVKMGKNTDQSTGIPDQDWDCWVGGLDFPGGDIDEFTKGTILSALTYVKDGTWFVNADFQSHRDNEDHNIRVVCARDGIVQRDNW